MGTAGRFIFSKRLDIAVQEAAQSHNVHVHRFLTPYPERLQQRLLRSFEQIRQI